MRRNGFTMVELIFVIIIIGILSVAAIPKFGDIKDRAKVNTEYSSLSGLDSAIIAAMEFHAEDDNGDIDVIWHSNASGTQLTHAEATTQGRVLSKVIKKSDGLKIIKHINMLTDGSDKTTVDADAAETSYDILLITGAASDSARGVTQPVDGDVSGKPDKNDFWVFNGSPKTIYVTHNNKDGAARTTVETGEIKLIDNDNAIGSATADYETTTSETKKVGFSLGSANADTALKVFTNP